MMKIYEIGTGYTSIPAKVSAATEIVVEELTKALLDLKADVEIIDICDSKRSKNNLPITEVMVPRMFVDADVHLGIMHKLKRIVYSIRLTSKLKKILRGSHEKVVLHFHNQYNLFFFLKMTSERMREKCIIAYTNHSGIWRMDWNEIEETIKKRYFQEAECMKKADIVYVLNDETTENAVIHLKTDSSKFRRIANGVNINIYHPLSKNAIEEDKIRMGLANRKVILQVGSVNENKGQLRVLKNMLSYLKAHKDCVYAYVGGIVSESYQEAIVCFASENNISDQVIYLGMVKPGEELNRIYNLADISIMASQYEAFGMVVIESLSAGIPVMINKNVPITAGDGVILYDDYNLIEIVDSLLYGNNGKLSEYKFQARLRAEEQYSWSKIAKDYHESWQEFFDSTQK